MPKVDHLSAIIHYVYLHMRTSIKCINLVIHTVSLNASIKCLKWVIHPPSFARLTVAHIYLMPKVGHLYAIIY